MIEELQALMTMADGKGIAFLASVSAIYLVGACTPKIVEYIMRKKEQELEKLDSVFIVYSVDCNQDVWIHTIVGDLELAEERVNIIRNHTDPSMMPIVSHVECNFGKDITAFHGYRPYSAKFFPEESSTENELAVKIPVDMACNISCEHHPHDK